MPDTLTILLIVGVLVVLVAMLAVLAKGQGRGKLPYVAAELLSPAERSFYGVLKEAVSSGYQLFVKIRLADLIKVKSGLAPKDRTSALNRISAKHIDFVLCDALTLGVVLAIELDDRSHRESKRQDRDRFVDAALAAASVPLLRVTARRSYSAQSLRQQIAAAISTTTSNDRSGGA